jgi:Subtilase family
MEPMKLLTQGSTTLTALSLIAALAVSLTSPASAQTASSTPPTADEIANRRAEAKARAEESLRELQTATSNAMAQAEERLAEWRKTHPAPTAAQQPAQQPASAALIEDQWQQALDAAQPFMRSLGEPEDAETPDARVAAQAELAGLTNAAQQAEADAPNVEAELDAISILLGVERVRVREDGSKEILGGQVGGEPVYYSSQNLFAAASISADELWPTNTAPWAQSSTGRNLTGTNVTLGLWEVDGAVMTNHLEFTNILNRIRQVDDGPTNPIATHWHPTGVAGTMGAGGNLQFTVGTTSARWLRGVAFQATLNAYDLFNFKQERLEAAAGTVTGQPLRLSNHSYGLIAGWIQETIKVLQGNQTNTVTNAWNWRGSLPTAEDGKFGFYTPDPGDGSGCTNIDYFLSQDAPRHLMIYAAGNDRLNGPGGPTNYYYKSGPGTYDWTQVINPPSNSRDWRNGDGDTGGYDTLIAPGTAKNVLTVGAVRDVYSAAGMGFATNAAVVLAPFSACGPTDDGRIKPDVVAVGQNNPTLRNFGLLTPTTNTTDSFLLSAAGTSFAAPAVAGGLGLAVQRRAQLFPNLDPNLDAWRGSTWRALAIHTADDVDGAGPDYQMGYGLFNAASAVAQVDRDQQQGRGTHIKEFPLNVGQTNVWEVDVDSVPFKVTAAWSDPPGRAQTNITVDPVTPMLVNNLDLRVERVGATNQYFPWILNPDLTNKAESVRSAAATTGVDNRNNVEQVYIATPTAGRYRIVVTHSGGLPGGLTPSAQWVSVLTSGDAPVAPVFTSIIPNPPATQMLLTFTADPGAYFYLLGSTNLTVWQTNATVKADGVTNSILVNVSQPRQFWRLRRQQ